MTKLIVVPVRQMRKGTRGVKVWVSCDVDCAQAYEVRDRATQVTLRRERSMYDALRIVAMYAKPKRAVRREDLVGRRWSDVENKL